MDFINIALAVAGVIGLIVGSAGYLKYAATKANMDGKDETIATLERQRDATAAENVSLRARVSELTGENRTLRDIATQTPEIIKLTESVTHLTESVNTQSTQTASALKEIVRLLKNPSRIKGA